MGIQKRSFNSLWNNGYTPVNGSKFQHLYYLMRVLERTLTVCHLYNKEILFEAPNCVKVNKDILFQISNIGLQEIIGYNQF